MFNVIETSRCAMLPPFLLSHAFQIGVFLSGIVFCGVFRILSPSFGVELVQTVYEQNELISEYFPKAGEYSLHLFASMYMLANYSQ